MPVLEFPLPVAVKVKPVKRAACPLVSLACNCMTEILAAPGIVELFGGLPEPKDKLIEAGTGVEVAVGVPVGVRVEVEVGGGVGVKVKVKVWVIVAVEVAVPVEVKVLVGKGVA